MGKYFRKLPPKRINERARKYDQPQRDSSSVGLHNSYTLRDCNACQQRDDSWFVAQARVIINTQSLLLLATSKIRRTEKLSSMMMMMMVVARALSAESLLRPAKRVAGD